MLLTHEELSLLGTECDYCNDDDRVLYAWHGDIWCARCMFEASSSEMPLLQIWNPTVMDADLADYLEIRSSWIPMLWQTPDGYIRCGRVFNGVYPRGMLDEQDPYQTPAHYAMSLANAHDDLSMIYNE